MALGPVTEKRVAHTQCCKGDKALWKPGFVPDTCRRDAHLQNLGHYSNLSGKDVLAESVVLFALQVSIKATQ